jgi:hypothetical protein
VVKFLVKVAKAKAVALLGERLVKLAAGALITIIVVLKPQVITLL